MKIKRTSRRGAGIESGYETIEFTPDEISILELANLKEKDKDAYEERLKAIKDVMKDVSKLFEREK